MLRVPQPLLPTPYHPQDCLLRYSGLNVFSVVIARGLRWPPLVMVLSPSRLGPGFCLGPGQSTIRSVSKSTCEMMSEEIRGHQSAIREAIRVHLALEPTQAHE